MQARALELTKRLVRVGSCSRTPEERAFASLLLTVLEEVGGGALEIGAHPVPHDPWERSVPWALLPGRGSEAVVLLSHYDTVDVAEYGALRECATDPDELHRRMSAAAAQYDPLTRAHLARPDEWLFGRGAADMKSGIAAHLVVLEQLCARVRAGDGLPGSVLFVCTPDEENESAGVLAAVELLARLERERGIEIVGAINNDYISARFAGDEQQLVYTGTVGKLLPSVYVRGVETHAGEPYEGLDANLLAAEIVRALSMRADLADADGEEVAPPPVTLKATDFKDRYDVQIPFDAYLYVNFLTFTCSPGEVLRRVAGVVDGALGDVVSRLDAERSAWHERAGLPPPTPARPPRTLSCAELLAEAQRVSRTDAVSARLTGLNAELHGAGMEPRERSARLVRELWDLAGLAGPAAVVYFSPPYYPHVSGSGDSVFLRAARAVAAEHGAGVRRLYPYISDGSYLSADGTGRLDALTENMPLWRDAPDPAGYSLPLEAIRALSVDVVNIGVWGFGAHKREERVYIPYSCGAVPEMILETVLRALGTDGG